MPSIEKFLAENSKNRLSAKNLKQWDLGPPKNFSDDEHRRRPGRGLDSFQAGPTEDSSPLEDAQTATNGKGHDQGTTRVQKGHDQGTTRVQKGHDQGTTRVQKGHDQGTTRVQKGHDQGTTRVQKGHDQGTTRVQKGHDQGTTRVQKGHDQGTTRVQKGHDQGTTRVQKGHDQGTTRVQKGHDQGTTRVQKGHDQGTTRVQKGHDQGTTRVQKGHDQGTTRVQKKSGQNAAKKPTFKEAETTLLRASLLRDILEFLHSTITPSTTPVTAYLSYKEISSKTGISVNTVKISVSRLKKKSLLATATRSFACTGGGASYRLSKLAMNLLSKDEAGAGGKNDDLLRIDQGTEAVLYQGTEAIVSSSSYKNNYKQTMGSEQLMSPLHPKRAQRQVLEQLQIRLDLDSLKLGLNDLLPLAHDWVGSLDEFAESLEHIVFYLRSGEASSIKNPKAWLLKQLRAGYYGAPANFVSWQDQQVEERIRARQQQAERRRQQRIQSLQTDFDLWLLDLTTEERRAIFEANGELKPEFITPPMQMSMLRTHFAQLRGVPEFLTVDLVSAENG